MSEAINASHSVPVYTGFRGIGRAFGVGIGSAVLPSRLKIEDVDTVRGSDRLEVKCPRREPTLALENESKRLFEMLVPC